ncbi:MAG: thiamine diphosphokinase [Prevotellaceae bacterium]|nr:thiamine diphosphokinase [Prevotellaceae bacterium]
MGLLKLVQDFPTVVLAHGDFPAHRRALQQLQSAATVVCCDGAVEGLLKFGMEPACIVGDLDSISPQLRERFAGRIHREAEQESNDLTKAMRFCIQKGYREVTILGATGKREDHTLGNISLLADYAKELNVQMLTDYGVLNAIRGDAIFESFAGQQVSLFCLSPQATITTHELKYPICNSPLPSLWRGTLNESLGDCFAVRCSGGCALVFREYPRQA